MGKRKIVRERHSSMHAQLVDLVRNHPRLWSKDKCSAEGETIWDGIADEMGVQSKNFVAAPNGIELMPPFARRDISATDLESLAK